ncbi:MAG: amino acid permease [Candidatus Omnitrophica bacterium]|nr:amino acid permease [Candidatus Omnitrophota bacterium]
MEEKLKRGLGLLDVFCIASGAMISSGLFILPALAYAKAGPAVVFSYIVAGILVLPALFAMAELATAMPKAGGDYFFIERSMGAPIGTIGGLASWFSLSFKSAFALLGLGIFATLVNPGIPIVQIKLIAVGCCLFFMLLNIIGVQHTGRFQVGLVLFLIAIVVLYVFRGFLSVEVHRFAPFMPYGAGAIFATAGLVFVSFGGLTKIACVAEEVKNPGRNIPLGMFLAFCIVMLLYAAVVFVTVGVLEPAQLTHSLTPISLGASQFMGSFGSVTLGIAAILAFVSTANAGILTASRDALAMSRDYLLPKLFKRIDARSKTPHFSIIFTAFFMIIAILFLNLENLVKTASTLKILLFLFVNLALIVMRESKIQSYRPKFHAPGYPWLQIVGILGYGFLIFEMGRAPLLLTGTFIGCSLVWYLVYARKRVNRQAALVHVIERITAKELVDPTLPDELKEIIIERDEIVEDRFDHLIKKSVVLDLDEALPRDQFFQKASHFLAGKLGLEPKALTSMLIQREHESHTVIRPGLAIPHVVVKGKHKFSILLARAKGGVIFPDEATPVHTIFLLVGTQDERNFHLRCLAAIAQIAQDQDFDQKWLAERNSEDLRDIILLAERKRFRRG